MQGPSAAKPSTDFERNMSNTLEGRRVATSSNWKSAAVTSFMHVNPKIASRASSSDAERTVLPITIASSTSTHSELTSPGTATTASAPPIWGVSFGISHGSSSGATRSTPSGR